MGEQEEYEVDISKRDVAAAIDALPETLSRMLLKLRDEGTPSWEGGPSPPHKGFWAGTEGVGAGATGSFLTAPVSADEASNA